MLQARRSSRRYTMSTIVIGSLSATHRLYDHSLRIKSRPKNSNFFLIIFFLVLFVVEFFSFVWRWKKEVVQGKRLATKKRQRA